jgi:hypothetical protein
LVIEMDDFFQHKGCQLVRQVSQPTIPVWGQTWRVGKAKQKAPETRNGWRVGNAKQKVPETPEGWRVGEAKQKAPETQKGLSSEQLKKNYRYSKN